MLHSTDYSLPGGGGGYIHRCAGLMTQGGELVGEPLGGGQGGCLQGEGCRAALTFWILHGERRVQGRRGLGHVVGVDHEGRRGELGGRAGLPGQHQRAAAVGQDRALLGDQVHAVADRVDQQHVGQPVGGERARVVVVDVEDQRVPVLGAELRGDLAGHPLHGGGVLAVLGQVVPGGVGEGHVHDPPAPFRVRDQQLAVAGQAADYFL